LPQGAWVLDFEGCVRQAWGHLENLRQDRFAAGLLWDGSGLPLKERDYIKSLESLDEEQSLVALSNISAALQICYAEEAWSGLRWLDEGWQALVDRWRGREAEGLTALVNIATNRPPDDLAPTWLPMRYLAADLPELFALPCNAYSAVAAKSHPMPVALRAISSMRAAYPHPFPHVLHPAVAAGFSNLAAMQRGAAPRGFAMNKFEAALQGMDASANRYVLEDESFLPGAGELLGPLHFRFALRALEQTYGRALAGNDIRRGQAIGLCNGVRLRLPKLDAACGWQSLHGQRLQVVPWWWTPLDDGNDSQAQHRDNLETLCHTLSWLAFICRADVHKRGMLVDFLDMAGRGSGLPNGALSFLLQVGESMFLFYLVLWEMVLLSETVGPRNERSEETVKS
jgi:hypothetical protein